MLLKLKDQSSRWYVKALFALLVVSFSMWGITDIFVNYVNMRPVATVDGHNISQEEFDARLQAMVSRAQELSKGQLNSDQVKEMGIPQKILDSLIDQKLIGTELNKRNLMVTDASIRQRIQTIPTFLNEQGAFDKRAFDYLLRTNHISEGQFIAEIRNDLLQQQLFGALFSGLQLPQSYVDLLFRGFFEQRVFAVVTVPFSKMVVKNTPKEADLKKFYQDNQDQFAVPEMRKVSWLEIDPKILKDRVAVTQDKLQEEYERRKAEFKTAEKREVKQVNFKDEDTAQKAVDSMKNGRPVPAAARDFSGEFKNLGLVTKQQLPDLVADGLFESGLGEITGPISTPFGWQVYMVSKIEPSFTKSFMEMRTVLESELKKQLANEQIYELKNKIEDSLAGGANVTEIAKENNFKIQVVEAVSRTGKDNNEKIALPETDREELLEQIFVLSENTESQMIETKSGTSYIINVDKIQPAHVPEFEKIKGKVAKVWGERKRYELSLIVAQQLVKDARSVANLSRMALSRKLSIKMLDPLSRVDSEKDEKIHKQFSPRLIGQMFELSPGKAAFGVTPELVGGGIQVVMLQKVLPFKEAPLKDKKKQMEKKLADLAYQDASMIYVKSLRDHASISINHSIYNSLVNRG